MQQSLRLTFLLPFILGACLAASAERAVALEPGPGEEGAIKACERQLCTAVLGRAATGPDVKCDVAKTWDRDTLKKGDSSSVSWGFGDARCAVDLNLSRADVIAALTQPKHVVRVPEHEVKCVVEQDGKPRPVLVKLAPKLEFKNGKADKIWINLKNIDGPTSVKATVSLAASLEDNLGIFHRSMVKSVNKFLHTRCGERYHADGRPKESEAETKSAGKAPGTKSGKPNDAKANPAVETGSTAVKATAKTNAIAAGAK